MQYWVIPDLISVGIPAYNEEITISRTLLTVINQDLNIRKEIIVCLNGCTDNTRNEINTFYDSLDPSVKEKNILVIKEIVEANKPKAWNLIKASARSSLIFYLDADMILNLNSFSSLINKARNTPERIAILSGHLKYLSSETFVNQCCTNLQANKQTRILSEIIRSRYPDKRLMLINLFNNISNNYSERERITGALYLIQKEIVGDIPEDIISEDTYLYRISKKNKSFCFVKEADAYHLPLKNLKDFFRYRVRAEAGLYQLSDRNITGSSNLISSWKLFKYIGIIEITVIPIFFIFVFVSKVQGYKLYKKRKITVGFEKQMSTKKL